MAEELPDELKLKLMKKFMRKVSGEASKKSEEKGEHVDPEKLVWSRLGDEKAEELLRKTKNLYPEAYSHVISLLAYMIQSGSLDVLDGYTLYAILQRLGIPVKPDIKIKFVKKGKEVDFKEYVEE